MCLLMLLKDLGSNDLGELWAILHCLYSEVFSESTAHNSEKALSFNEGKVDVKFLEA